MFSFDPRKVLPPWASLQRLLDGQCDAWSRKDRVHHVLDTSGLSLVDSRPHRGTQQYLVLTKQNLIHRLSRAWRALSPTPWASSRAAASVSPTSEAPPPS